MKIKRLWILFTLLIIATLFMTSCGSNDEPEETASEEMDMEHNDEHMDEDEHHMEDMDSASSMGHMHVTPPAEYVSLTNPFAGDSDAIAAGKTIFETNCVTCHGPEGKGNGDAAVGLDPQPANLTDAEMMGMVDDAYLFFRVSEGGAMEPWNSAMPTWKDALSETQRWQVVTFVRTLSSN